MSDPHAFRNGTGLIGNQLAKVPAQRPAARAAKNEGITPQFVLHAIRRWWKVAAPLGILLAAVSLSAVFLTFQPTYRAVGRLRILEDKPYLAYSDNGTQSKRFVATQLQLIRLPSILEPVAYSAEIIQQPELAEAEDPVEYLREHIKVKAVGDSEIYEVEYEASTPDHAKMVVDAVMNAYIDEAKNYALKMQRSLVDGLDGVIADHKTHIDVLRSEVTRISEETGIAPTQTSSGSYLNSGAPDPILEMRRLLVQAEVDLVLLTEAIKAEEERLKEPIEVSSEYVDRAVEEQLAGRRQELETRKSQLEEHRAKSMVATSPFLRQEEARIKMMEEDLTQLEARLRVSARQQLVASADDDRSIQLEELKWKRDAALLTKQSFSAKLEQAEKENGNKVGEQWEVDFKNRELLLAESIYEHLLQQDVRLRAEEDAPSRVENLDENGVRKPEVPVEKFPLKAMLIALLASFAAPLGLVVGWEWTVKRVNNVDEITQQMGIEVLGEIVSLPRRELGGRLSKRSIVNRQLFEESVDGLRTTLVLADTEHQMQVLAVASAVSSEGKTSVATQLAISLARTTGKPNLLIDGDMRAPDLHRMFDVPIGPGLADVLAGDIDADEAVVETDFSHLHVLPAGLLDASPHRLLHNGAFRKLLDKLREQYQYIIIDTPPVLGASEALVMAQQADATLICAMRDKTRVCHLQRAQARLDTAGAKMIGVVMSGLPVRNYAGRYGSYTYGAYGATRGDA